MGLKQIYDRSIEHIETNRQIGPMSRQWLKGKSLGITPVGLNEFIANNDDAILDASEKVMTEFGRERLAYKLNKGLDFVARFNNKCVIGEAKFFMNFGKHQNAQFNDAITTITSKGIKSIKVAI